MLEKKLRGYEEKVKDIELDYDIDNCYDVKINYTYLRQYTIYLIKIITQRLKLFEKQDYTLF